MYLFPVNVHLLPDAVFLFHWTHWKHFKESSQGKSNQDQITVIIIKKGEKE